MTRHVFYSFHFQNDNWRASQVRHVRAVGGNKPAHDNDWETIKKGGDNAIKNWIEEQMKGRSCTIVLVGSETAGRRWINHEIIESWNKGMGVAAINIHGLKDSNENVTARGNNPLDYIAFDDNRKNLSEVAKCYNPPGIDSRQKYKWIGDNLEAIVEEAINIRQLCQRYPTSI